MGDWWYRQEVMVWLVWLGEAHFIWQTHRTPTL